MGMSGTDKVGCGEPILSKKEAVVNAVVAINFAAVMPLAIQVSDG